MGSKRIVSQRSYAVKLPSWEGPLDLLLTLIRDEKLNIFDIPLKTITQQYLNALALMEQMNLTVSADFLSMATTLILIKTKMLLPVEMKDSLDDDLIEDPRRPLVRQLLEYQRYKEVSRLLLESAHQRQSFLPWKGVLSSDSAALEQTSSPTPYRLIPLQTLSKTFAKILAQNEARIFANTLKEEEYFIEEKISLIQKTLPEKQSLAFDHLYSHPPIKAEVVITFGAILELYRTGYLSIFQKILYGKILLSKRSVLSPSHDA